MPDEITPYKYPLIDSDPHFSRVVGYMRPTDYAAWAAMTAAAPAAMYGLQVADPINITKQGMKSAARLAGVMGFMGGFLFAYQQSSFRFWGKKENAREVEMDMQEMTQRVREGKSLYGESELSPYLQKIAFYNSKNSQYMLHTFPWFNLVNHPHHGVDTQKYYDAAKNE